MTIDKERLRVLAEAVKDWSDCNQYQHPGEFLKLAEFYAVANPAAVLALLSENAALAAEVERLRKDAGRVDAYIKFMRDNAFNPELHAHETRDLLETCKRLEEWRSGIND